MIDQNSFMETLDSVKEIMRVAETPMSEQEILAYFDDMELSEEHKKMVLAYLQEAQKEEPTGEESEVFKMYLEEIASLPTYTKEEETALYERLSEGDTDVVHNISNLWLARVLDVAKNYQEPKLRIEDLVQEGNMALFLKLQELCGSGTKCDVEETLKQEIEAGIVAYVAESRGEWEMENAIVGKASLIHQAKKLLAEETGQEPSLKELADYTKIPEDELKDFEDFIQENGGKE